MIGTAIYIGVLGKNINDQSKSKNINLVGRELVDGLVGFGKVVAYELLVHVFQQRADASVRADNVEAVGSLSQGAGQLHAELYRRKE